ncbi:uncharacterized protein LOC107865341 [Capsicum annuum]|uniref:uncharacterized protein LOC107865341 n=1 Tax=Capsicum annuum TaxID=4072 RepID=UPI0007BEA9D1|nr:uncharacterized protein LOC107865341 [Capsicum annuum]
MSKNAKYLRDVVAKKLKLQDMGEITLTKEYSAVMTQKIPQKLKDQGKFAILIQIRRKEVHALSDLGESINLIPLSLFEKLGLGKPRSTTVVLKQEDGSMAYPNGIIEDILIKIVKFVIPANFIVLDFVVDKQVPIILGRLFLVIGGALMDIRE